MDQSPLAIHHVGVAVPSIDDAMHFYGDTLGLSLVDTLELPDRQLKVAFVQTANMLIELLEPTDPNSTVSRFLERRGPGLHHLCFGTPDIRRHLKDLQDKGVELIDAAPRPGAHGEVAFLQPTAGLGVLVELFQATDEKPPPASEAASAEGSAAPTGIGIPSETTRPAPEVTGPQPTTETPSSAGPPTTGSGSTAPPTTGSGSTGPPATGSGGTSPGSEPHD
jgi:methylmalonyl-CoA/ethylmalonyl-CoA epimerase